MIHTLEMVVNPFNDLQSGSPDRIIKPTFEHDEKVDAALDFYLNHGISAYAGDKNYDDSQSCLRKFKLVLEPVQINLALQNILGNATFLKSPEWHDLSVSLFLKKLVQDSYNELGFDRFIFDSQDFALDDLFLGLSARKKKPITITLNGNAGELFGNNSENCRFYVSGGAQSNFGSYSFSSEFYVGKDVVEHCGHYAANCVFNIQGDAAKGIAMGSTSSQFNVNGNAGNICGMDAKGCLFNVAGEIGKAELANNAQDCVFVAGKMEYDSMRIPKDCVFVTLDANDELKALHGKNGNEVILL